MNKGYYACADPEGGGGGVGNHKLYMGFSPPPPVPRNHWNLSVNSLRATQNKQKKPPDQPP